MKWKITAVAVFLLVVVGGVYLTGGRGRVRPHVKVTLRLSVAPAEKTEFVVGQANTALFKYRLGRSTGVEPAFAQRLSVKAVPNSSLVEAQVGVGTKEEAKRYVEVFVEALQAHCGPQVQLAVAEQTIR